MLNSDESILNPVASSASAEVPVAGKICLIRVVDKVLKQGTFSDSGSQSESFLTELGWIVDSVELPQKYFEVSGKKQQSPSYRATQLNELLPHLDCDFLILTTLQRELPEDWVNDTLARLKADQTDLVVSHSSRLNFIPNLGLKFLEKLTGCQQPEACIAIVRKSAITDRKTGLRPAGRWISLELQLRVSKERTCFSSPLSLVETQESQTQFKIGHTELSFVKSFIDLRFGNISRLIQFCAVGFSGMLVDLSFYALFQVFFRSSDLADLQTPVIGGSFDLALSGFLAVWLAMTWNFLLNRRLTFNDARRNSSIVTQYMTYTMGNSLAIVVSLLIRLWLPTQIAFFDSHKLLAALVGIVLATGISFSMARYFVFKSPSETSS
jgi:putative flippase GtrA